MFNNIDEVNYIIYYVLKITNNVKNGYIWIGDNNL